MRKVAIVEDNADIRLLVRAILERRYRVVEFASGHAALEGVPAERPDLVLLDISLPGMDGTRVLESLRQHSELDGVPVVALTAHTLSGDRERFLDTGFDHYLAKPILDVDEFVDVIDGVLAGGKTPPAG